MNRFKCEVQHGKVFPCDTLDKAADNTYTRSKKGIFELVVTELILDKWISNRDVNNCIGSIELCERGDMNEL